MRSVLDIGLEGRSDWLVPGFLVSGKGDLHQIFSPDSVFSFGLVTFGLYPGPPNPDGLHRLVRFGSNSVVATASQQT